MINRFLFSFFYFGTKLCFLAYYALRTDVVTSVSNLPLERFFFRNKTFLNQTKIADILEVSSYVNHSN